MLTPLEDAGEVGDDVAEHVRGDDDVVGVRVLHHPHAAGVDVVVVGLHVGVVLGHFLERPPPEIVAVGEDVGLGDERERLLGAVPLAGVIERPADAPLAALPRVDGLLHRHFVGRALFEIATHATVEILRVLADDDEVDVLRAASGQRRLDAGEQFHRAKIDVLIEFEPQFEKQALLENTGGDLRVADGAEEDRVLAAEQVEAALGNDLAGLEIAVAAPVERFDLISDAVEPRNRLEHLHRLGRDLGARSVSGKGGNLQRLRGHG